MNENLTVVILAAGLGTRMRSSRAKVLHQAGGDTLLNQVLRAALALTSPEQIVVVVGHQAEQVRASVSTAGVRFAEQTEQLGTGHAVACAREAAVSTKGTLLILNGDGPLIRSSTLQRLLSLHEDTALGGAIVTTELSDPSGYGRIVRDQNGRVAAIVEQKSGNPEQLAIREVNPGLYCFDAKAFWEHLGEVRPNEKTGEYYLTDMVEILRGHGHAVMPLLVADETELLGINTRIELAVADKLLRRRKAEELMLAGVTLENPDTVTIDMDVTVGTDTLLEANVQLRGRTRIGANCHIGTGSVLRDCEVADDVTMLPYVIAEASRIGPRAFVGPFARLRMQANAGADTHIGNFVELKKTQLGDGSKANHLAYLGDSQIGTKVNVGAGTITCNYDGKHKHATHIGNGVFVGSNSTLIAPLAIGDGAYVAAGSVVSKDVTADSLAIGRSLQIEKTGWAKRRRETDRSDS